MSRTDLRAMHYNTVFGQLWLLLNPLLLAGVYFVLVDILRGGTRGTEFFAHLMAGLFAYYFVSDSVRKAVRSVVSGGRLMLNAAAQVYFRDLKNVLPYALRIWLYASPVLYYADEIPQRYEFLLIVNPL